MDNAPKKSLGQHWLNDPASLQAMLDAAEVQSGDQILEVGPGQGSLTSLLLDRGASVVAVELDSELEHGLRQKFTGLPFTLNMLSILDFDLGQMNPGYKVVANIPYYITAHLLRMLSETQQKPQIAALLVQKEVAQRVVASPGELSILGVITQFYWEVSLGVGVPAALFTPPPKVDSQILILKKRPAPLFDVYTQDFFRLVKGGFANKRKTLANSLSAAYHMPKTEVEKQIVAAGLDPTVRAQALSLTDWHELYRVINK